MANVSFRYLTLIVMLACSGVAQAEPRAGSALAPAGVRPSQHRISLRMADSRALELDEEDPSDALDQSGSLVDDDAPLAEPMADGITAGNSLGEEIAAPVALEPVPQMMSGDPSDWDENYWQQWNQEPPAPTCHSGTWFNRGSWYFRQDFVYMSRFSTDTRLLVADYTDVNQQTGIPTEVNSSARSLGFEPGGRTTLGRFLCRDQKNRDHSLEFVFFGLFDWQQDSGMTSRAENALFTLVDPYRTFTGLQVGAFNAAQEQSYAYDSSFDTYELNYVIAQRLGRDRLEMTPEGEWVRKLTPGSISTWLGGVRYVSIGEGFDWRSAAADPTEANGIYQVTTQNQMLGLQLGHELVIQRPKFRFGIRNKIGSFINYADQDTFVNIVDNRTVTQGNQTVDLTTGDQTRIESGSSHDMTFMYDLSIMAAYHIRPNIAIRTGYEFMFINQLALAPEQLSFVPSPGSRIVTGGAMLFNGFSLGLEMVW